MRSKKTPTTVSFNFGLAEFGTLLVNKQIIIKNTNKFYIPHVPLEEKNMRLYRKKNLNIHFSRRINKIPVDFQDFHEILKFQ